MRDQERGEGVDVVYVDAKCWLAHVQYRFSQEGESHVMGGWCWWLKDRVTPHTTTFWQWWCFSLHPWHSCCGVLCDRV